MAGIALRIEDIVADAAKLGNAVDSDSILPAMAKSIRTPFNCGKVFSIAGGVGLPDWASHGRYSSCRCRRAGVGRRSGGSKVEDEAGVVDRNVLRVDGAGDVFRQRLRRDDAERGGKEMPAS